MSGYRAPGSPALTAVEQKLSALSAEVITITRKPFQWRGDTIPQLKSQFEQALKDVQPATKNRILQQLDEILSQK